jgi:hypothetical protein
VSRILRNNTNEIIFVDDTGTALLPDITYEIHPSAWPIWAASSSVIPFILNESITVNDGVIDLKPKDGIDLIKFDKRNFSYARTRPNRVVVVPEDQQMFVYKKHRVDTGGELVIYGEVIIK